MEILKRVFIYLKENFRKMKCAMTLKRFFFDVRAASRPLTDEIAAEMKQIASKVFGPAEYKLMRDFQKTRLIPELPSLISVTRIPSKQKNKDKFITEWNETLQLLRNIADRLALKENLPVWINATTPKGVLVDQFLHAYYYNQVKDGINYPYDKMHDENKADPERALLDGIEWWRKLESAPSDEDIYTNEWAPEVRKLLDRGAITGMSENDFVEVLTRIHAVRDHAAKIGHQIFGLTHALHKMKKTERAKYFARWLYTQRASNGSTSCDLIDFVLYGGAIQETPERLFNACSNPEFKIPHLGVSSLGEMIGWAMPDNFPPRNGRTSKALTALGFDVAIHSE
jgi:hypothetical protein